MDATMSVNPTSGAPGSTFTVSGTGCRPESLPPTTPSFEPSDNLAAGLEAATVVVQVAFNPALSQTVEANAETGNWSATFTVPAGTPPGSYAVTAECLNSPPQGDVSAADFGYPGAAFNVVAVAGAQTPAGTPTPGAPAPAGTAPAPTPAGSVAAAPGFTG